MPRRRVFSELHLVNGSTGDPVLYVDYPDRDNALLLDAGDNSRLSLAQLADLRALFISHHHVDHFIGLDRIVRANIDADKILSIYGPPGTISKVYQRIKSYEYMYFPFQKIVLRVVEVHADQLHKAQLECRRRFPEPEVEVESWDGGVNFENGEVQVEAAATDHTVSCLAYAMVEKPGYHLDQRKLDRGMLKRGDRIVEVLQALRDEDPQRIVRIQGGTFHAGELAQMYFRKSGGARIAFVADTRWSDRSRPGLLQLADRAQRLYCDCYYAAAQRKQADRYGHMTAVDAAELAREAGVEQLVLMHSSPRYRGRCAGADTDGSADPLRQHDIDRIAFP